MTRIIAGAAGGRRLAVPGGTSTRPTSDRAKEGLFSTLLSEIGSLGGKRVLDLYAGSGAVGLEALSRGADSVLFVESDARAAAVIKANIKAVDLPGAHVLTSKVERALARHPVTTATAATAAAAADASSYDFVFADPPYAVTSAEITKVLTSLTAGWLAEDALVVVERATRSGEFDWPPGYRQGKSRRYGEATFWYGWYSWHGRATAAGEPEGTKE